MKTVYKNIKIKVEKANSILNLLKKKSYLSVLNLIEQNCSVKIKPIFLKLFKLSCNSLILNYGINKKYITVDTAYALNSRKLVRSHARAKGRSYKIIKHYSHLVINLKLKPTLFYGK